MGVGSCWELTLLVWSIQMFRNSISQCKIFKSHNREEEKVEENR